MSKPTSFAKPNKRSNSPYSFPAMKKAKSQAVACSLDPNKNAHQQFAPHPHVHFAEPSMIEDDPSDGSPPPTSFGRAAVPPPPAASLGGVTANLSRKKATPPQPTKKLVIKLVKGSTFLSLQLLFRILYWI